MRRAAGPHVISKNAAGYSAEQSAIAPRVPGTAPSMWIREPETYASHPLGITSNDLSASPWFCGAVAVLLLLFRAGPAPMTMPRGGVPGNIIAASESIKGITAPTMHCECMRILSAAKVDAQSASQGHDSGAVVNAADIFGRSHLWRLSGVGSAVSISVSRHCCRRSAVQRVAAATVAISSARPNMRSLAARSAASCAHSLRFTLAKYQAWAILGKICKICKILQNLQN